MAVTRSPYGGVTTIVPHFKVKNTLLKNRKRKFKKKRMLSFLFEEEGKLFIKKSSIEQWFLQWFLQAGRYVWPGEPLLTG